MPRALMRVISSSRSSTSLGLRPAAGSSMAISTGIHGERAGDLDQPLMAERQRTRESMGVAR